MAFFDRFKKNKKDQDVNVEKRKQNMLQDAAVAVAFAEAGEHETARSIIDKSEGCSKILVIGREDSFSELLVEYSVDMAKRLGFELMALNVLDAPLSLSTGKREEATALFQANSAKNVTALKEQAENFGVSFDHLVEVGQQDEVLNKLHAKYPGMRYVLTEPDPVVAKKSKGKVAIPVFDLGCSHGAAA
ncbi:MAG: universal stress protein [Candidatus Margulisbacteria bacterium]|nr:universal stress protein [Candidatus Margulisiibacteriota bacterium]